MSTRTHEAMLSSPGSPTDRVMEPASGSTLLRPVSFVDRTSEMTHQTTLSPPQSCEDRAIDVRPTREQDLRTVGSASGSESWGDLSNVPFARSERGIMDNMLFAHSGTPLLGPALEQTQQRASVTASIRPAARSTQSWRRMFSAPETTMLQMRSYVRCCKESRPCSAGVCVASTAATNSSEMLQTTRTGSAASANLSSLPESSTRSALHRFRRVVGNMTWPRPGHAEPTSESPSARSAMFETPRQSAEDLTPGPLPGAAHSLTCTIHQTISSTLNKTSRNDALMPSSSAHSTAQPAATAHRTRSLWISDTSSTCRGARPDTMMASGIEEQLTTALENMAIADPPAIFARRYVLSTSRTQGGQSLVNFARDHRDGFLHFAIKFFYDSADFEREVDMYGDEALRQVLPELITAQSNSDGHLRSSSGFVFPPFIVLERGVTLSKWKQQPRNIFDHCSLFQHIGQMLEVLHRFGRVHRDLKPENILHLMQSSKWRLLDLGIVAKTGEELSARCTLAYAAPEVVKASHTGAKVKVREAQDIFALGVIMYECISCSLAMHTSSYVYDCAYGRAKLPWEEPLQWQPEAWRHSKLRPIVEPCLARHWQDRPSASRLVATLTQLGQQKTR